MKTYTKIIIPVIAFVVFTFLVIQFSNSHPYNTEENRITPTLATSININSKEPQFQDIIDNPESRAIKVTMITLRPNNHRFYLSEKNAETLIITLGGNGILTIDNKYKNKQILELSQKKLTYCPPNTALKIKNTGQSALKYLYLVIDK
jgi:mannose-6-phosphate isomerase-like protein (cupin superfamily)